MTVFCIFMILLIIILFFRLYRQYVRREASFSTLIAKALLGMLGISFVTVLVLWLLIPAEGRSEIGDPQFFPAIIYTVQMYSLDTNVEFFRSLSDAAGTAGSLLIGLLMVINPVLLLGTISRMILTEILRFGTKMHLSRGDLFIFPSHDEKAVYLAASILREKRGKILFCSLSDGDESYREVIKGLEPHRVPASSFSAEPVTALLDIIKKKTGRRISVFFTEENYDLYEEVYRKLYTADASLYFFTDELGTVTVDRLTHSLENEMEQTEFKGKAHIHTYCIDPVKDSIWRHFLRLMNSGNTEEDPFRHLDKEDIHVSIAGWTPYGEELMKTMMWLGNMYGHRAYIHMYHTGDADDLKDLFLYHFPAFSELYAQDMTYEYHCASDTLTCNDLFTVELNPVFSLKSDALVRALINDRSIITAFTLDNDTDNIHLLEKYLQRTDLNVRQYLFVHCEDEDIAAYARDLQYCGNFGKREKRNNVHISFIGIPKEFYSYSTIADKDLDDLAVSTHLIERTIKAEENGEAAPDIAKIEKEYRTSEYNRRSSMASALQKKASVQCIPADYEKGYVYDRRPLIVVEHDRWSAYMIALGYIPAKRDLRDENHTDPFANTIKPIKRHTDITPYEYLPEEIKKYDNVTYIMDHMDNELKTYLQNLEDRWKERHS